MGGPDPGACVVSTRQLLQEHTADLIRPRWEQHKVGLGNLVTTVHNEEATDAQAEVAALAFLEEWGGHPVYRKTARYGLILYVMRDRPETWLRIAKFSEHVQRLNYADIGDWYRNYTGGCDERLF